MLLIACAWLALWAGPCDPAALTIAAMALGYALLRLPSGISPWKVLLAPLAASAHIYALLRSMIVTL